MPKLHDKHVPSKQDSIFQLSTDSINSANHTESKPNLSNIKIGQIIKNYKELCSLLNLQELTSNSKRSQLKNLERFIKLEKIESSQKYVVQDIYKAPLPIEDKRISEYTKCIELILLYNIGYPETNSIAKRSQLFETDNNYDFVFYKNDLLKILGMVNNNYKLKYDQLSKILSFDTNVVTQYELNIFYAKCDSRLSQILMRALNNLKHRFVIDYQSVLRIIYEAEDKNGMICEYSRFSTDPEDIKKLLTVKHEILTQVYHFTSESQIFIKGLQDDFYDLVNKRIYELYHWKRAFKQYRIIASEQAAKDEIPQLQYEVEQMTRSKLNTIIYKNLLNDFTRSYNTRLEKSNSDLFDLGVYTDDPDNAQDPFSEDAEDPKPLLRKKIIPYPSSFLKAQSILLDGLIRLDQNSIEPSFDYEMLDSYIDQIDDDDLEF